MVAEVLISHIGFIQCRLQIVSCDCDITISAYIVVIIGAPKKMLRIERPVYYSINSHHRPVT